MYSAPRISHVLDKKLILTNYKNNLKLDHVRGRVEETRFIEEQKKTLCSDMRKQKIVLQHRVFRRNVQQYSSHRAVSQCVRGKTSDCMKLQNYTHFLLLKNQTTYK